MSTSSSKYVVIGLVVAFGILIIWFLASFFSPRSRPELCKNKLFTKENIGCYFKTLPEDQLTGINIFYRLRDIVREGNETYLIVENPTSGSPIRFRAGLTPPSGWMLPTCKVQKNNYDSAHTCGAVTSQQQALPFAKGNIILIKVYQAGPPPGVDPYAQKCFPATADYYKKMLAEQKFSSLSFGKDSCYPIAGEVFYP